MSNPAKYLADFFERDGSTQHGESYFKLLRASVLLEEELDARERANARVDHLRIVIPEVRNALRECQSNDLTQIRTKGVNSTPQCLLDQRSISLLRVASDLIDTEDFASDESTESIRTLLENVKKLVIEDNSLPPEMRLFISKAVIAIEMELNNLDITGDFDLREALLRLFGLMQTATATSKEPGKWSGVWDSWGVPIAQGLIVSIPQVALAAGAVFQQIQQ